MLFCALSSLNAALTLGIDIRNADRLRVSNGISIFEDLPVRYARELDAMPNISAVTSFTWFGGMYQEPRNFFMSLAVDPLGFTSVHSNVVISKPELQAWMNTRQGAVVGMPLAERHGWAIGDLITLISQAHPHRDGSNRWQFEIVGTYATTEEEYPDGQFLLRQDYLDGARARAGGISWFAVQLNRPAEAADTAARIDTLFRSSGAPTLTQPEGVFAARYVRQFVEFGNIFLGLVALALSLSALIAIGTVSESINERHRDFTALRAIGFSRPQTASLIVSESVVLISGSAVLGIALGCVLVSSLRSSLDQFLPGFRFDVAGVMLGLLLALVLGLAAAFSPALRALSNRSLAPREH